VAPIGFRILPRKKTNPALVALFEGMPASIISDNLSRLSGPAFACPMHRPGTTLLGTALTVRVRSGDNLMIHKALQIARPGDVLVIDGGGCLDRALLGEIMKNVAKSRGWLVCRDRRGDPRQRGVPRRQLSPAMRAV
jgi:regulator of RNase E activity RraA